MSPSKTAAYTERFQKYLHDTRWKLRQIGFLFSIAFPRLEIFLLTLLLRFRNRDGCRCRRRGAELAAWYRVVHYIGFYRIARDGDLAVDAAGCRK